MEAQKKLEKRDVGEDERQIIDAPDEYTFQPNANRSAKGMWSEIASSASKHKRTGSMSSLGNSTKKRNKAALNQGRARLSRSPLGTFGSSSNLGTSVD